MNIGFLIDSLPPINRPSANRGVSFIKELIKSHTVFVFSYSNFSEYDSSVRYHFSSEELKKIKSIQINKPKNVKYLAALQFLMRFSILDTVTRRYLKTISRVHGTNRLDLLIISIGPVERAKVGYRINNKLGIPWVLDYRDEWTSQGSQLYAKNSLLTRLNSLINREVYLERKYTKNIKCFTTVFEDGLMNIQTHIGKKGFLIENGYFLKNYNSVIKPNNRSVLKIAYLGTFYDSQLIPESLLILNSLLKLWGINIKVHFIGTNQTIYKTKFGTIFNELGNIEFSILPKVPLETIYRDLPEYDALIHSEHFDQINVPSSKLYDYIALGLPVLLLKSYGGYMTTTLRRTRQLILLSETEFLQDFLTSFESRARFMQDLDNYARSEYSREKQMEKMNEVIKFSLH